MKYLWCLCVCLIMAGVAPATDVSITWTDSVLAEDAYIFSGSPQNNYGRVIVSGVAGRVIMSLGPSYSNRNIIVMRPVGLGDTLTDRGVTADSGHVDLYIRSITWTGADSLADAWFYLLATGIADGKDWIEGAGTGGAAACGCCYDSAVKLGTGGCTGIDWGGGVAPGDTMGTASDSVKIQVSTTHAGDKITIPLSGAQIEAMRTADNGFAIMSATKSGNLNVVLQTYGGECFTAGAVDSIPVIVIKGHTINTPANIAHTLTKVAKTASTLTIEDAYASGVGVDTVWTFWHDAATIAGADSACDATTLGSPDTVVITGLAALTEYWVWYVISEDYGRDTSDAIIDTTVAAAQKRIFVRKNP
jgi:hypothetical protein